MTIPAAGGNRILGTVAGLLAGGLAAWALRLAWVDPAAVAAACAAVAAACAAGEASLRCGLRAAAVLAFVDQRLALLGLVLAALAWARPGPALQASGVAACGLALGLHHPGPAALGAWLLVLAAGRPAQARPSASRPAA